MTNFFQPCFRLEVFLSIFCKNNFLNGYKFYRGGNLYVEQVCPD